MTKARPPISMIIEWGEVEAGISAIHGAMQGVAGMQVKRELSPRIRSDVLKDFGRQADLFASKPGSGIAHVYEWGMEGQYAGRLWKGVPSGSGSTARVTFTFLPSTATVLLGGDEQSDAAQRRDAEKAGAERAYHVWTNKAADQEYNSRFVITAGTSPESVVQPGSSKKRGTASPTKFLLIYDQNGNPLFRRRWINYSEYTGNFTTFFENFWEHEAPRMVEAELVAGFERVIKPMIHKEIKDQARGRGMIHPGTPAPQVINSYSNGRPFRGFAKRANAIVEKKVRKLMKDVWK